MDGIAIGIILTVKWCGVMSVNKLLFGIGLFGVVLSGCSSDGDSPSVKTYTITWKNYNGAVLEVDKNVKENTTPTYNGATPTRPDDSTYTYTWSGWSPKVVAATSDKTYTATFNRTEKGPEKVTIAAHTLKDTDVPVDVNEKGDCVDEDTWNYFKYGAQSIFNDHYNFTYTTYSYGVYTQKQFTKNGYHIQSSSGQLYYERKSGNTFYQYIASGTEWLRQETTLDLQNEYASLIHHEIYVDHLDEYSNYEYDESDGVYWYRTTSFAKGVKFQDGYITYLHFGQTGVFFDIELSFETQINIPKSYYYK